MTYWGDDRPTDWSASLAWFRRRLNGVTFHVLHAVVLVGLVGLVALALSGCSGSKAAASCQAESISDRSGDQVTVCAPEIAASGSHWTLMFALEGLSGPSVDVGQANTDVQLFGSDGTDIVPDSYTVSVDSLLPGQTAEATVKVTVPSGFRLYETAFSLTDNGPQIEAQWVYR